ncbi:hypothetical protein ABZP36_032677 [Zizania latifolia]
MSAHLRLLSAAPLPALLRPAPTRASLRRLPTTECPPLGARARARARFLALPPEPLRLSRGAAVRCRSVDVAGAEGDGAAAAVGIWEQVRDIVVFAGPALGLWICGPLMSLIDTMVIGQTSSLQLAALGPGTVFCDYLCYIFMFLSIATSNMVATALAKKDEELAQHQVSMLLFVALTCGIGMFLFTKLFGTQVLTAFTGSGNYDIISAANTYAQVAFYALLTYSATSMGAITLAAHQVMVNVLCMCTVWGEPLSQTAQSFMPELIYGAKCNLMKARMLLKSLVMIGSITGLTVGAVGTLVPWLFPSLFTNDLLVVQQMHQVLIPYFCALLVTPSVHSLEGTLLAGRDLRFLSQSMGACFSVGTFLLLLIRNKLGSLSGCWWILVLFQWSRFGSALQRLLSPTGMLYNENFNQREYVKVKAT